MSKKKAIPQKYQIWIDVRKKYHLSNAHIQMARELGLNPKKFGKLANYRQEPWKASLPDFIEKIYFKRFGKTRPDNVRSIEQLGSTREAKKANRSVRDRQSSETAVLAENVGQACSDGSG